MDAHIEIINQAQAFEMMEGDILTLIKLFAEDFRRIINEFETMHHRIPSPDDLIWIGSQHAGYNIRFRKNNC